jgi:hypothetical protein
MPCQACRPHFAAAATLEWDGPAYELIEAAKKDAFAAGQLDGARKMQEACIQRIRKFWHRPIEGHAGQPYMRTDPTWAEACCKAIDPAQVVQGTPPQEPPK